MASLETIASFNGTDGAFPNSLVMDVAGDLLGVTSAGGVSGGIFSSPGVVFEIAKTATGYADTPTVLATTDVAAGPFGVTIDSNGNLYGASAYTLSISVSTGTVFELPNMADGYASTPTVLASTSTFFGAGGYIGSLPGGGVILDAQGDLIYATNSPGSSESTIFEIAKTTSGYAHTPTMLASLGAAAGYGIESPLLEDANGNLFGTTTGGGANALGTVFEIVKTPTGYNSMPVVLANFTVSVGALPQGALTMDANGDLFGTSILGGANNDGTVFELTKTADGYSSTPTVLVSFNGTDGSRPASGVIIDADGNLFGTTSTGGPSGGGTAFELAKTADGYASTPTTLVTFDGTNNDGPTSALIADANGNLFGTTGGNGTTNSGTVFEITNSGFATCFCPGTRILTDRGEIAVEALAIGDVVLTVDGEAERVRWIGQRDYAGRFVAGNPLMLPVTIRAEALAEGVPVRDLHVSPGHAMLIDGQLVPAWRLVNGVSVTQATSVERVSYYHIELNRHAVIVAEGAPAESFLDDACRGQFQNAHVFHALHPDVQPMTPLQPRLEDGFALQAIQERIALRAGVFAPVEPIGPLRGFVDEATGGIVRGWALDRDSPEEPVALEVIVEDRSVLCVLANVYREDLRRAGLGSGCHAFTLQLPDGVNGAVVVRRIGDGAVLRHVDKAITPKWVMSA